MTAITSRSENPKVPAPYSEFSCWYGIKLTKRDTKPCGLPARLYRVERQEDNAGFGFVTTMIGTLSMEVWLCENHKASMTKDGFYLHLVR